MCGCACIASMGRSSGVQVECLLPTSICLCLLVFMVCDAGPNELFVVDHVKAVVDVFGAGGILKGECEYLMPRLPWSQHADRHILAQCIDYNSRRDPYSARHDE